ncbi:MAG: hypothetical protein PVSMB7_24100 [Chloroflexota bacterium]
MIPLGSGVIPSSLVVEPEEGRKPLIRALNLARSTIFLEMYILTDRVVMHALERAAAEGVSVYVLLEPHPIGMGRQPEHVADVLRASGVNVRWAWTRYALTHAKLVIVDDRTAVVSTANFSRAAFTHNREFLVFLRSMPLVHELSNVFRSDWDKLPVRLNDGNLPLAPVDARQLLTALLTKSRRSIEVFAEEVADARIENLLEKAVRRGVRVRVLLPQGNTPSGIRTLRAHGVSVRQVRWPYIHAKAILVDDYEAFVGSENISAQSLDHNREVGVFARGWAVQHILTVFERDWRRTT